MRQNGADQRSDSQVAPPSWTPTLMLDGALDGAPLPANASIRDYLGGTTSYVDDAVEQALLLLEDMADRRSMRRHKVLLSLKRDLAMVSLSIRSFFFSFYKFPPLSSSYYLCSFTFTMFLSSTSHSSHVLGRGDNKLLPPPNERKRWEAQCRRGGLQLGRKMNK